MSTLLELIIDNSQNLPAEEKYEFLRDLFENEYQEKNLSEFEYHYLGAFFKLFNYEKNEEVRKLGIKLIHDFYYGKENEKILGFYDFLKIKYDVEAFNISKS